jgi:glycosyltransferase involved in cell wall biosynthesis
MKITSEKLLTSRQVVTGLEYSSTLESSSFTVFVGIYNASPFLALLLEDLEAQTFKNFPLIVVDNRSTDDSWEQIQAWPLEIRSRAKLIRNPINLGGTGSFALNSSEVETDWVITVHQDDNYRPNHLQVLAKAISNAGKEDLVIFSDMGTQDLDGNRIFTPIRQSWVADLGSRHSSFRANLVQQSVSYPSSAFRTDAILPIQIAWHSSSFPDTEITLTQASKGQFKFIPELTMLYRMNPKSESHDLNPKERVLGPFASLCRVMASDSFLSLCATLPEKDRSSFAKSVLEGIELRLGESPFSEIVKMIASETMGLAWDYSDTVSRDQLLRTYKLAEDGRTTKLLEDLGAFYTESKFSSTSVEASETTQAQQDLVRLLDEAVPPSNVQGGGMEKAALTSIGMFLPLGIRRKVIAFLVKIYARLNPKSPWNLTWKPKH